MTGIRFPGNFASRLYTDLDVLFDFQDQLSVVAASFANQPMAFQTDCRLGLYVR